MTEISFSCRRAGSPPAGSSNNNREIFNAYTVMLVGLPLLSMLFLYLEHLTHLEFMIHLAAIPLEIMFGAIIVERYLSRREKRGRLRQLMHMKSFIFRSRMREIFINNFNALVKPRVDVHWLADVGLEELQQLREGLDELTYGSLEDLEATALSYIDARPVFVTFMEWAIQNDFESILEDMVFVLCFIQDVRMYKKYHPDKLFVEHALSTERGREKLRKVLTDGVSKFLDYAIELKSAKPEVYDELMSVYLLAVSLKEHAGQTPDAATLADAPLGAG